MKALSPEQYAHLRGDDNAANRGPIERDDGAREKLFELSESLRLRGCTVRTNYPDGSFGYSRTPLGELALRVARPEMAFTVPT